jgi:hypothetical protein
MKRLPLVTALIFLFCQLQAQIVINEYCCSNLDKFPDNYGEYEDYIELYNTSANTVTLSGYYVSDNPNIPTKWLIPAGVTINPNGFKKVWCSGRDELSAGNLHSNFRLTQTKVPAETICIADPSGIIIDQRTLEITQLNHSRGRTTDGSSSWSVFTNPTPGTSNNTSMAYAGYTLRPAMNVPAGFYSSAVNVTISSTEPGVTIRYTTDGNEPNPSSTVYSAPVNVALTKILKARAFSPDPSILPGLVEFNTYFINESHTVPVVSIAANQLKNLLNGNGALMPAGSFEYFDEAKVRTTTGYGQFGKHGQDSWVHPQRSLDWKTRDEMGYASALQEQLFTQSDREEFQRLILRASGDDNYPGIDTSAHIRDDFVQTLSVVAGQNLDVRKSRRCVIYTNGQFWGVYAIREKVDDHDYTEYYYGQDKFNLYFMMLWGSTWAEYGGQAAINDWETLYTYITTHPMSVQSNYDYVVSQYDPTSLTDYMLINSLVVCSDWLNWNVGWWKGLNPAGDHLRWGYILWDEDATFGHYINYTGIPAQSPYLEPCFHEALTGPWHDPEGHVTVLNALLENDGFRQYYINRYVDLMNTGFKPSVALTLFDSLASVIQPEMQKHTERWGGSVAEWTDNLQKIRDFYNIRYQVIWDGMNGCYNTTGPYPVTVDMEPAGAGYVQLNSLTLKEFPFSGQYYGGISIALQAMEVNPAYEFDHWEVTNHTVSPSDTSVSITLSLTTSADIVAVFIPRILADSLVINEINYHSSDEFNPGDWIEFYNPHNYPLDISGWKFKDEVDTHVYTFPLGTTVPSHGYLVLTETPSAFDSLFPAVTCDIGPAGFGFSGNGELLRLYDELGMTVDTVHYDDVAPWPTEPDGTGPTLELINPGLDNALAQSWDASCNEHGTPGARNCVYVSVSDLKHGTGGVSFHVIPNPMQTSARIIIETEQAVREGTLVVYNLLGIEVLRISHISSKSVNLERGHLPGGSYYFRFSDQGSNLSGSGKLIID